MSIRPDTELNNFTAASAAYPLGSAKNETAPGANDGSEFKLVRANDIFGLQQALLQMAGITATGNPDSALNKTSSQYLQAILHLALSARVFTDSGAADAYVLTAVNNNPAPDNYQANMTVEFIAANTNTGPSTANLEGLGAKNIFINGAALVAGDIIAGERVIIEFDSPNDRFNVRTHVLGRATAIDVTLTGVTPSPPDANTIYADNVPKAWVTFDGTGVLSILDSFNISGVVDNGTGDYTISFDRDFDSGDYCMVGMCKETAGSFPLFPIIDNVDGQAVGSVRINTVNTSGSPVDCPVVGIVVFGAHS